MPRTPKRGPKLYERDGEIAGLRAAATGIDEGGHRILLVEGAAGTGKTSLLEIAVRETSARGLTVLRAHGDEHERDLPWGIVLQLFERTIRSGELDRGPQRLCRPIFDASGDAAAELHSLLHGLYWLAISLAETGGLALIVDDAQLADRESLAFVGYLARRLEGYPIGLFLAERSGDPAATTGLDRLRLLPGTKVMRLGALGRESVASLVQERGGDHGGGAMIWELAAGNPWLSQALVGAPAPERADPGDGVQPNPAAGLPDAVGAAIRTRLRCHGDDAIAVAEAVAVLGPEATPPRMETLTGLPAETVARAIDSLAAADILTAETSISFSHPLVRELVYGDLPSARRALMHRRTAMLLRQGSLPAARLAAHVQKAGQPDQAWQVETLTEAGRNAFRLGAPDHAVELFKAALSTDLALPERHSLLIHLGRAELAVGNPQGARHLEVALEQVEPDDLAAVVEIAEALFAGGCLPAAAAAYERGATGLRRKRQDRPQPAEARLLAGLNATGMLTGNPNPHIRWRIESLIADIPRSPSAADRVLMAMVAGDRGMAGHGDHELVARLAAASLRGNHLPDALGRVVLEPALAALLWCDRYDQAEQALEGILEDALERGEFGAYSGFLSFRAYCALRRGPVAQAAALAAEALRIAADAPGRSTPNTASARWILAEASIELGDLETAMEAADSGQEAAHLGDSPLRGYLYATSGSVALAAGRNDLARQSFLAAGELYKSAGAPGATLPWRSGAALAAARLGSDAEAERLATEELDIAERFGAPVAIVLARRTLAALRGGDEALALLGHAEKIARGSGAPVPWAHTLVDLGAATRRSGQNRAARDWLRQGIEIARRSGADRTVRRAVVELEASGARRPELELSGPEALTPSERRVAELAASGASNRQIAAELFVTRRTVEAHLTATYRKLEIASREQLPAALAAGDGGTPSRI